MTISSVALCGPMTSYVPRRGDAYIWSNLDLEWKLGVNGVVSDEIHCLLGCDVCCWVNLCQVGQIGDVECDKYVSPILTDDLY